MPGLQTGCTNLEGERSAVAQQSELSAFLHSMRNRPGTFLFVISLALSYIFSVLMKGEIFLVVSLIF